MSTSVHAVARAVMIIEHTTHGVALTLVDFSPAVTASNAVDLNNGALTHLGASTFLLHEAFIAIRRTGLGMILGTASMLVVRMILVSLAMTRTVNEIAFRGEKVFIAWHTAVFLMIVSTSRSTFRSGVVVLRGHDLNRSL